MKTFTTLKNLSVSLSQNSSPANSTLMVQLVNDAHRYLLQKYFNNENSFSTLTVGSQQAYDLPPNYSKLKDVTITVGQLKWTPREVLTRREWDEINMLPYTSDIPNWYFIYNGKINIFPIPSTSNYTITFNYKIRVPDLSIEDYSTGTVAVTNGSKTVTGTGTSWVTSFLPAAGSTINESIWVRLPYPQGDGDWYQVSTIDSATQLTLVQPYQGITTTGAAYTMGQVPLLLEDFQDLLTYRPLTIYFSSINKDESKAGQFKSMYDEGIKLMDDYLGTKSVNVDLGATPQLSNPNLFIYAP